MKTSDHFSLAEIKKREEKPAEQATKKHLLRSSGKKKKKGGAKKTAKGGQLKTKHREAVDRTHSIAASKPMLVLEILLFG